MHQYYGRRVITERSANHLTRIDRGMVNSAITDHFISNKTVLSIKKQQAKLLTY